MSDRRIAHHAVEAALATSYAGPLGRLVGSDEHPIGIGHTADTLLLDLTWEGPGPLRVVAKVPSVDTRSVGTASSLGLYERELRFYAELAPRTTLSVPRYLGPLDAGGFLLEDLCDLEAPDQLAELAPDRLTWARRQLAELQGPFWEDPGLAGADWLHRRLGVPIPAIHDRMRRSWAETGDRLASGFDGEERDQVRRFVAHADSWAAGLAGPRSLVHHDFRVDNMLFAPDHVVVLDWQTVGWGAPMFDLAYLMGTSLSPEARRACERDVVRDHLADLAGHGVVWPLDEAWAAYRAASFAVLLMLVPAAGSVRSTDRGDVMFRRLIRRGARMALDLGADEFLPAVAA